MHVVYFALTDLDLNQGPHKPGLCALPSELSIHSKFTTFCKYPVPLGSSAQRRLNIEHGYAVMVYLAHRSASPLKLGCRNTPSLVISEYCT